MTTMYFMGKRLLFPIIASLNNWSSYREQSDHLRTDRGWLFFDHCKPILEWLGVIAIPLPIVDFFPIASPIFKEPDILNGTFEPGRVFDVTVDLDGVPEGYRAMNNREALKVLIRP